MTFVPALTAALRHALRHLEGVEDAPVAATADLATLRSRLGKPLDDEPIAADVVVEELARDARDGLLGTAGGRFFGWVIGGSVPAALAADWLTSTWDQNAGMYATSPAAAVVEEVAGEWLKDLLGLPAAASFAFVTGCQMAHATCLAAARNHLLAERKWDVEAKGLFGAPAIRVLTSVEKHGSLDRALRLIGFGTDSMELLPVDGDGRLEESALRTSLENRPEAPTIVVLQAGDLNIGAYDDFAGLIPLARKYKAWVHVDGAFGLWAAASPRYRHLLNGAAGADSWATDGHKWLNVPYDSGYAFVANREAHRKAMSVRASYLTPNEDARDQIDWNPEFSRRARGFATYAALRQLGRSGVARIVEQCCECARLIVEGIGNLPGAEAVRMPQINQGLVRFPAKGKGKKPEDDDRRTDEVIAAIQAQGGAFFGGTTWRGRRAMRVSVSSWRTTPEDAQIAVRSVAAALDKLKA